MSEGPSGGTDFQILRGCRDGCSGRETRVREMANWLFDEGRIALTAIITFFWSLLMFCLSSPLVDFFQAEGLPEITEFAVMDLSGVLSQESHDYFNQASLKLKQDTGAEIFVAAVPVISGSVRDAARHLYNGLKLGSGEGNNGVLIFFTTGYPRGVIHVGSGLKSCINDSMAAGIRNKYTDLPGRSVRWNTSARNAWNAVARYIYRCQGSQPPAEFMEEKGYFAENAVKTYNNRSAVKIATVSDTGAVIIPAFAFLAMGAGIMLVLCLVLAGGADSDDDQGWSGRVKGGRSRGRGCFS